MREHRFYEICRVAREGWLVILIAVCLAAAAGYAYCRRATPLYRAQAVVAPMSLVTGESGPRSILPMLTGEQDKSVQRLQAVLSSSDLAKQLIDKDNAVELMGVREAPPSPVRRFYDAAFGIRLLPEIGTQADINALLRLLHSIGFERNADNLSVTLSFDYAKPESGRQFLADAVAEAQAFLVAQQQARLTKQIEDLQGRFPSVLERSVSGALTNAVISKQVEFLTRADDFSIIVISPPTLLPAPVWPRPVVVIPAAVVTGLVISILWVFFGAYFKEARASSGALCRSI